MAKVSVIIPSYNRYELVCRAIESARHQDSPAFEIIIVDDCSTQPEYAKLNTRPGIHYLRLSERSGMPGAVRNFGIKHAKGDWIAFLDDDDFWLPNKLSEQLKWIDKYSFICSEAYCNGQLWNADLNAIAWQNNKDAGNVEFDYKLICNNNFIINSSVLIKKDLLEKAGYMPETPLYRGIEDYLTWLEVLKYNYLSLFIAKPLLEYNQNSYKHYLAEAV